MNKHLLLKWCAWPARLQLNTEYEPANKWQIKVDLKTENLVLVWVPTAAKADGRRSQLTEKHVALYSDQSLICVTLCTKTQHKHWREGEIA